LCYSVRAGSFTDELGRPLMGPAFPFLLLNGSPMCEPAQRVGVSPRRVCAAAQSELLDGVNF
jgi:hypothetical protein